MNLLYTMDVDIVMASRTKSRPQVLKLGLTIFEDIQL